MKNKITFRKLYQRIGEKDYGSVLYSIIVFEKIPFRYNTINLSKEEAIEESYQVKNIAVQYSCFLMIDLWILVLKFKWLTKFE